MDLSNLVGMTGVPSVIYYVGMTITAIFFAGWFLNSKLRVICEENNRELEDDMREIKQRLTKHETETLKMGEYNRDMASVCESLKEIRSLIEDRFNALTLRIDNLSLREKSV